MARWDDLRRAILAKDIDGTERIWLELLERSPSDPMPFIEAADLAARQVGGRRNAATLLGLLVDSFKEQGHHRALIPVYGALAGYAPDDGTLRDAVIEAAQQAYPDREDLEILLEKSAVRGGAATDLAEQIAHLDRLLHIEEDAWVFHKSGWGVGRVVEYYPDRGRCVIDFRARPNHEMDIAAAARLLDRLEEDDIRVQAMSDPKGLRKRAKAEPLEMIRQTLARYSNSAPLRNVKEALVPDAVATSTWSTWWKEAKKQALLDPRFNVGPGRDPRIEFHDIAQADFDSQVERALKGAATATGRQQAVRDLATVVASDDDAKQTLAAAAERELGITHDPAERVGWELLISDLTGRDPMEGLAQALSAAPDPVEVIRGIPDAATRGRAATALVRHVEDGPEKLLSLALSDDPEAAKVAAETLPGMKQQDVLERLLKAIDSRPAQLPNLYAWYLKRLVAGKLPGRSYDALPLVQRLLKVLDAVEYRLRRHASAADKRAVTKLTDILTAKNCAVTKDAAKEADENAAHHLVALLGQNRALKARALEKLQESVLRIHPQAMREQVVVGVEEEEEVPQAQIYMTAEGIERLRAQRDKLVSEDLPTNAAEIARAREFGDLSENAEYHAAREKQSLLQAKADQINADLARAVAIKPDIVRVDAVSVGSRVRLRDGGGEEISYTLFGPPDADVSAGIINYLTPLGQALMGQEPGSTVRLDVAGEVRELEVLEIENGLA